MKTAGMVSAVYPNDQFREIALKRIDEISLLPPESVSLGKSLIRNHEEIAKLHAVNQAECEILSTRYNSDEAVDAVIKFMSAKMAK